MTSEKTPRNPAAALGAFLLLGVLAAPCAVRAESLPPVSAGPQYDSTHVYVAPAALDSFVNSFVATFGGTPSKPLVTNVLPVPSRTTFRYVMSPVGTLSVFAFQTPIPFPFGAERTGWLVRDMDKAVAAAGASGAAIIVEPFRDPIGRDAVVEWPGGVKTQLYWHFKTPSYPPLQSVPENRVYVSRDRADVFVRDFIGFSRGSVVSDDVHADAGEIGRPGETCRRILIESGFGKMVVFVTDGHLPYPFGREVTGYEVADIAATLAKAKKSGATVLVQLHDASDRKTAMLQFPGGYIAEVHAAKAR